MILRAVTGPGAFKKGRALTEKAFICFSVIKARSVSQGVVDLNRLMPPLGHHFSSLSSSSKQSCHANLPESDTQWIKTMT